MRLLRAEFSNVASFGPDQVLDFTQFGDEPVLIIGENRDEPGANSNGSGKSSLMHIISWCLFGRLPTKVPVEEIVRLGSERADAKLWITEGGSEIEICRYRDNERKKDRGISWIDLGAPENSSEFNTATQAQEALCRRLRLQPKTAFTDFLNSAYFSVEAMTAFTSRSGKSEDRMSLIARFLGLDVLDVAKELAKTKRGGLHATVSRLREELADINTVISETDIDALRRVDSLSALKIKQLREKIAECTDDMERGQKRDELVIIQNRTKRILEGLDARYEGEAREVNTQITQHGLDVGTLIKERDELQEYEDSLVGQEIYTDEQIDVFLEEIHAEQAKLAKRSSQLQHVQDLSETAIDRLTDQMTDAQECPECKEPLVIIDHRIQRLDMAAIKAAIEEHQAKISSQNGERQKLIEANANWRAALGEVEKARQATRARDIKLAKKKLVSSQIFQVNSTVDDLKDLLRGQDERKKKEREELEAQIVELDDELEKFEELNSTRDILTSLNSANADLQMAQKEASEAEAGIKSYEYKVSKKKEVVKKLKGLKAEFDAAEFWMSGFPTIRRWRIDSFLPEFEMGVNRFLELMEVGMRVQLNTTRKKKRVRGDEDPTRAKFTIQVQDSYGRTRDIETFSMGESRRIGMAVGFALRDLTLAKGTNRMDFVLLDEVVDSLDGAGTEAFFRLLPALSGPKFVISHDRELISRFDHVITVVKEDGISNLEVN